MSPPSPLPIPPSPPLGHPGATLPIAPPVPLATWRWWEAIAIFVLGVLAGLILAILLRPILPGGAMGEVLISFLVYVGIAGTLVTWLAKLHKGWRAAIPFPVHVFAEVWAGFVRGMVVFLAAGMAAALAIKIVLDFVFGENAQAPEQLPDNLTGFAVVASGFVAIVVAPVVEEFFFRGVLFGAFRAHQGFWLSALASSFAFGAIHYIPGPETPPQDAWFLVVTMMFVGFGFAFIYERRKNILAPIVAHATFNVVGFILIMTRG
ncbi:MAG: type II CAAX endopeptidase family protein [Actinomycetota bacterium]